MTDIVPPNPDVIKKIAAWQDRLLDFTRRNPLFSLPANSFDLLGPPFTIAEWFARLTNCTKASEPIVTFLREPPLGSLEGDVPLPVPLPVLKPDQRWITEAQYKRLANLRAKAVLIQNEQGISTLFAACGILRWLDPKTSVFTRSPLLLVPVKLEKLPPTAGDGFVLHRLDDEIRLNSTLRSRLAQADIGWRLTPPDDEAEDIAVSLERVSANLETTNPAAHWEVVKEACFLNGFSFSDAVIYEDLVQQTGAAAAHPLVAAFAAQTDALNRLPAVRVPPADALDDAPAEDNLHILPTDPSQERAVLAARMGQSFVLQGPPGTGKTQTITNIIAACIADGKRVLFVSEKMAALNQVYDKLKDAGLGDWCLEAHSRKVEKGEIQESLHSAYNATPPRKARMGFADADALNEVRTYLNQNVRELHEIREPLGISLYEAFGFLAESPTLPYLPFVLGDMENIGDNEFRQRERLAQQLSGFHDLFVRNESHPWREIKAASFSSDLQNRLRAALTELLTLADTRKNETETLAGLCGLLPLSDLSPHNSAALEEIAALLARTPRPPAAWLRGADLSDLRQTAEASRDTWRDAARRRVDLEYDYAPAFFALPHPELSERLTTRHDASLRPALGAAWAEGTPAFYAMLGEALVRTREACQKLAGSASAFAKMCGLFVPQTLTDARFAAKVAGLACADPRPLPGWFSKNGSTLSGLTTLAKQAQNRQTQHDAQKADLTNAGYLPALFALDIPGLLQRFSADYTNVLRFFKPAYWRDRAALQQTMGAKGTLKTRNIVADLQAAQSVSEHAAWFESSEAELIRAFGPKYQNEQTDWPKVLLALQQTQDLCALFPLGSPPELQARLIASSPEMQTLHAQTDLMTRHLSEAEQALGAGSELAALSALPEQNTTPIVLVPLETICHWCETMRRSSADLADARATVLATRRKNAFADASPANETPVSSRILALSLTQARQLLTDEAALRDQAQTLQTRFASFFNEQNTDWESLLDALLWTNELCRAAPAFGNLPANAPLPDALIQAACFPAETLAAQIERGLLALQTLGKKSAANWHELSELLRLDDRDGTGITIQNAAYFKQTEWAEARINCLGELERFIAFTQNKAACKRWGMTSFWEVITRDAPPEHLIVPAFRAAFYKRFVETMAQSIPGMANFSGREYEAERETFARLDRALISAAPLRVWKKAYAGKERQMGGVAGETAQLKKWLNMKKPWHLRVLFSRIPRLLGILKPCLLMSPVSVSTFLEAGKIEFDVVVFDEASQIFPESAIGSLLRGKQAIIAGDRHQMPPFKFGKTFAASGSDDGDDGDGDDEDYESILDLAEVYAARETDSNNAVSFAARPLLYHYRSRNESLIAFSRQQFYKGPPPLQTFPSASRVFALGFEYVENGRYYGGEGKARNNPMEAARVVDLVVEQRNNHPEQTVGVIAMSEAQQEAIRSEIQKRVTLGSLPAAFSEDTSHSFFVKNLENVQGDERDVIFISVGYGPDASDGKLRLNFGPLNKKSGKRRLNVAITRARIKCVTVASFRPAQLSASAPGLLMLRQYMEYAASNGHNDASSERNVPEKDLFADALANALTRRGYSVQRNVGLFDFRMDIGVLDDENPDRFLLGIECDGANYVSGETARAREYLRDAVLRGLEWRICRVWAADYARNPAEVLQTIEAALARVKNNEPEPNPLGEAAPVSDETAEAVEPAEAVDAAPEIAPIAVNGLLPGLSYFVTVPEARLGKLSRAFWDGDADAQARLLTDLVNAEGPLLFASAAQKIASAAGFARTGNRLLHTVREAADAAVLRGDVTESDGFLWPAGRQNAPPARVPAPQEVPRPIETIALEEIGAVLRVLLRAAVGMTQNEAVDETARLLGFARTGPVVKERITSALSLLELERTAHIQGGQVYSFDD